ncbi:hypothetical protein FA95DRAFT_1577927 [Auriscalpium vulgare]|uniref:Uncharacterized protein n=1 Tax=Auriscalpium vulgare TaxID=40419 RepID=A0ACB8R4W4_9AGAM|nr:hypothetical protein FA95DRAFT_1577927 [Auriscalpium vulgare]
MPSFEASDSPIMWAGGSPVIFAALPPAGLPRTPPPTPARPPAMVPKATRTTSTSWWGDEAPITPLAPAPIHARARESRRRRRESLCASPVPAPIAGYKLPPMSPFGGGRASATSLAEEADTL